MSDEVHPAITYTIDRAFATLDRDPQILLETDGGPVLGADIVAARLIGHDDQVDHEWMLPPGQAPAVLYAALGQGRRSWVAADQASAMTDEPRRAVYRLQSGWFRTFLDAAMVDMAPSDMTNNTVSVLCVRYRRDLTAR